MTSLERVVVTNWMMQGGGSAAPVIMLCYYSGQQVFEEYMDKERWETYKKDLEWEQLPVFTLEYEKGVLEEGSGDKMVVTNSLPTLKMLGKVFGYYFNELKSNNRYKVDVWLELCSHMTKSLYPSLLMKGEELKTERENLIKENGRLWKWFFRFNRKLEKKYNSLKELKGKKVKEVLEKIVEAKAKINDEENTEDIDYLKKDIENMEKVLKKREDEFLIVSLMCENKEVEDNKDMNLFLVDNTLSIADFNLFSSVNSIIAGRYKGIDKSFLEGFPYLNRWFNDFFIHYKKVLESKPKKDKYPYIVHNGRYYVNGKDQTEYWGNQQNRIPKEYFKNNKVSGVGKNTEHVNIKMTQEQMEKMNLNIKKEIQEEILTRESTLKEVETASVKLLKNTLKKHNISCNGVSEKHELIRLVKETLTREKCDEKMESV
jgi:hypothetical protein